MPDSSTRFLDLTTTELCDGLVGGVSVPATNRLGAAARTGVPRWSHWAHSTW